MISKEARTELLRQTIGSDLKVAAQIYEKLTNRPIYPRYLDKFLRCQRNPTGRYPKHHNPLRMFEAIAMAVRQRKAREQETARKAEELVKAIIRDTRHQPIPL